MAGAALNDTTRGYQSIDTGGADGLISIEINAGKDSTPKRPSRAADIV